MLGWRAAIVSGDKRSGVSAPWNQIKLDRQYALIAKVNGAEIPYTDDSYQAEFAKQIGQSIKHTWGLDLPNKYAQKAFLIDRQAPARPLQKRSQGPWRG